MRKHLYFFILAIGCWLLASNSGFAQQAYPQLDIAGFKKWEYKKVDVNPTSNYFSGLTQLGGYSPNLTGGPWQERLQLRILGQLSDSLGVSYDLEQQPETPDRYDVKVKYYENELTFGDINANFSGNEFASTSKFLNGVMLTAKDSWYNLITVPSAKSKSQTQSLTTQKGTNIKGPYNLGRGSILEGSESIWLNNIPLTRNVDYTIDYFEGKVTFSKILTSTDEFKYTYEYTNILDMFFPALSKRDFFGFQTKFIVDPDKLGRPEPKKELLISSAIEKFPSIGSVESDVKENEASGQYQLQNFPVIKFSEKVNFMGSELKRNEDYTIRYEEGALKLLTRFLPTTDEVLSIEYKYAQTSVEADALPGFGSRGPYLLSHQNLVPASEKITVDGKLCVKGLDYSIDYDKGNIIFSAIISPTSQIKATYSYKVMVLPIVVQSKFPKELNLTATYLKETAKAGTITSTMTAIEGVTGQKVINDDYTIYLQNRPVVSTGEAFNVTLSIGNRILTREVDYTFPKTVLDPSTGFYVVTPEATLAYVTDRTDPSDGYQTGTIKILNNSLITATSEVSATYTYSKWVAGKYSGVGNGTRGPYFLRNIRNIVPGMETVQVWQQGSSTITNYTRNASFDATAGDTGYSINYNSDNPSILFNNSLPTNMNFQVIYQYIPPSGFTSRDISQSVFGLDGSFKIGDLFKLNTTYAKSDIDRVISKVITSESTAGNGAKNYILHSPGNLIEESENIYINGRLLNKDTDYYISYTKPGQVSFYYITPTSSDTLRFDYNYEDVGSVVSEVKTKSGYAYKLGAETKLWGDMLYIGGNSKSISYDFTPMGGTSIPTGSRYLDYTVKLAPGIQSFFTNYLYKENNTPLANQRDKFSRSYDNSISTGFTPLGLAKISIDYRTFNTLDDLISIGGTHNNDTLQDSYALNVIPSDWQKGPLTFTQGYDLRRTRSQTDTQRDSNNFNETSINFMHCNGNLKFTERLSGGYDLQLSEPKTIALKSVSPGVTIEAVSSQSRAFDTSYNLSADLTFPLIQKWTARFSALNHENRNLIVNFIPTAETPAATINKTYHTDFNPFSILTSSLDYNRQEQTTFVVGGENPKTERSASNVAFNPFSWLTANWNGSVSESVPETGAINKSFGNANSYSINYTPISINLMKLGANFTLSDSMQTAPSGTLEPVRTNTNSFAQNYSLTLAIVPALPINFGLIVENYKNKNNHPVEASRIDTETENSTFNTGITLNPLSALSLGATYNIKTTKIIHDLRLSPQERKKTLLDSKVSYQIFSWGSLIYSQQDESNGGEIQAGAVADLNYLKTTQNYSLSINIPTENPVLSSFGFIASLKAVDYKNLFKDSDNFRASLVTFEGNLNF